MRPSPPRFFLPLLVLLALTVPLPETAAVPTQRHIRIEAGDYGFTPNTVQVNPGDRVTLELVSLDYVHGLYLDGYDIAVTADPGQPAELTFIADRSGTFRFRCSVACGPLHPFMIGQLQVGSNTLLWQATALMVAAVFFGLVIAGQRKISD